MKITTEGFPASDEESTDLPETVSGRLKLGIGVPSSRMLDGVAILCPYRGSTAPATSAADRLRQPERLASSGLVVDDGVDRGAAEHTLDVAARLHVRNQLDPKIEAYPRAILAPALRS